LKSNNEKHKFIIAINDDSNNDMIYDVFINYWHKKLQLTKNDENMFFNSYGWFKQPTSGNHNKYVVHSQITIIRLSTTHI
jgi:hypothetical protein